MATKRAGTLSRRLFSEDRGLLLAAVATSIVISLAVSVDWIRSLRAGLGEQVPVVGEIADRDALFSSTK